jgi:hypothetical protein
VHHFADAERQLRRFLAGTDRSPIPDVNAWQRYQISGHRLGVVLRSGRDRNSRVHGLHPFFSQRGVNRRFASHVAHKACLAFDGKKTAVFIQQRQGRQIASICSKTPGVTGINPP